MNQSAKPNANPNRSAAAQFFLEDDNHEDYSGSGAVGVSSTGGGRAPAVPYYGSSQRNSTSRLSSSSHSSSPGARPGISSSVIRGSGGGANHHHDEDEDKVPELLMKAAVTSNDDVKLENLQKVKDIIVVRQPALLDNFLDEILNFQLDGNPVVRRFILEFILQACEADQEIIPKILDNMVIMLSDPKVSVQKKAIQVSAALYKLTLKWLCRAKSVTEEMGHTWNSVNDLKKTILRLIDSDNDAIRTHTVKFIETVILLQTATEEDGLKRPNEFCLDDVPITVKAVRPRKLEEDARTLFEELLKFHGSRHATSVNLMTVMGSIVIIAKLRPSFMVKVVTAIEKLNAILPPTLERSQVTSVRKYMKAQLITLLRHRRGPDYYDSITTLLTDLGATYHELSKAISNWDSIRHERKKRQRAHKEAIIEPKRIRLEPEIRAPLEEDSEDDEEEGDANQKATEDQTQEDVASHLNEMEKMVLENLLQPEIVADLVIASMKALPDKLPSHFTGSFTPVAIAGTETQVRHVSRLLATQITAHQLGPAAALQIETKTAYEDDMEAMAAEAPIPSLISNAGVVGGSMKKETLGLNKILMNAGLALQGKKKSAKPVKLSEITKPFSTDDRERQIFSAVKRILRSKEELTETKCELISSIVTTSAFPLRSYVMEHIKENIKDRLDLGLHWVFGEYSLRQGFLSKALPVIHESPTERYDWTFFNLMRGILDNATEGDKASLAWRLFMEPPVIPDNALDLLKILCANILQSEKAMNLLTELTLNRPKKLHYLSALLEFCSHAIEEIRGNGVRNILKLYSCGEGVVPIEDKAVHTYLSSLRHSAPPEILFTEDLGRPVPMNEWNEELVKACLHLYLQLLTVNNELIHCLGNVYVETTADIKRVVLRMIEAPIRKMGMHSPSVLKLLDTFPKGAETLITKIIHILTDKTLPSAELVSRVRNLYSRRVSDVRFLIPVLNGLSKAEILSALPKLIKLNPNVVKEVFNRLLGIHSDAGTQHTSPITPVDLMVALHNIDTTDVKTVIKATSLCFNEADVYTAEVLAMVINQLLDQNPLPMLLMRTIIQAIALHPQLTGFIMSALSRMIGKKVWTQPKVWEGFIKCCQRAIPKSVPILLQLPPLQLNEVLQEAPDIREPLISHLMAFSQHQRASMDQALLDVIFGQVRNEVRVKQEYYDSYSGGRIKAEPGSPGGGEELSIAIKNEPMEMRQGSN